MDPDNVVRLPTRFLAGPPALAIPLVDVASVRSAIEQAEVAFELVHATLDKASAYGEEAALRGVHLILTALAVSIAA